MAANEDYFAGAPNVKQMFFPIIKDDLAGGQALAAGQADWKYSLTGPTYNEIKDNPDLKFVEYPDFGFYSLYFNQREGSLFADKNLRQAVSYCFDKEATVARRHRAARAWPIYSEIPPASWAFPTQGLNTYPMDQAKAKELIEVVRLDPRLGRHLREGRPEAVDDRGRARRSTGPQQVDAAHVRPGQGSAAWTSSTSETDFTALLNMLTTYPHINAAAPETGKPFDAYFGGFNTGFDPDPFSLYHSSECSTAERPDTNNYICYQNAEVDKLIEDGLVTFDQAERADDLPGVRGRAVE